MQTIVYQLEKVSEFCGRILYWLTPAMVLTTFAVVVLRYVFDVGWIEMQESVSYMHSLVFMLGGAYAFKNGAHVRVDIFYVRFSEKQKAWVDLLGDVLLLMPMCVFIFVGSFNYVATSWSIHEASQETGGLPYVYLLKTVIPAMAVLMLTQAIADALRQLDRLITNNGRSG